MFLLNREIGTQAAQFISEKSPLYAISLLKRMTLTLYSSEDHWLEFRIPICNLKFEILTLVSKALSATMQISDIPTAMEDIRVFLKSECRQVKLAPTDENFQTFYKNMMETVTNVQNMKTKMSKLAAEIKGMIYWPKGNYHH